MYTVLATMITIDLMQLLLGLLILVGIVLGVYLIITLARMAGAIKKVSSLVDEVGEPLVQSASQLPDLVKKLDGVAKDMSVVTESANQTVPTILKDTQVMTSTARAGVEAVGGAIKHAGDGISSFFHPRQEDQGPSLGGILEIVSQVISLISLFKGSGRSKTSKRRRRR
jgi:uncharacterized protein YoxC